MYETTYYPFQRGHPIEGITQNTGSTHRPSATLRAISLENTSDQPTAERERGMFSVTSAAPVEGHSDHLQACSTYSTNTILLKKLQRKLCGLRHSSVTSVADVCHHSNYQ